MPPKDNIIKVGIDPVFKGSSNSQNELASPAPQAGVFNILNNQQYTPGQPPITLSPNPTPVINTNPKSLIRTYKSDIESTIGANHLSSINIAIAENEKMHSQLKAAPVEEAPAGDYSRNKIIIFASVILIVLGIIGVSLVFLSRSQNPNTTTPVQELPALITTEYKDELNVNSIATGKFTSALSSKLNDIQIPVNNFYNPYITIGTSTARRLITSSEFVSLLGLKMPDLIARTILPDFMVGMYFWSGQNMPFIILKTSYFENAYAGMLAWENNLEKDFQVLFRLPGYEMAGNILAALTPTTSKKFEDTVIVNKDVRLLRDANKNIVLLYGIINKDTIVITVSDNAFKGIVDRLNKESGLKR